MLPISDRRKVSLDIASPTGATRPYEDAGMHVERRKDACEKELRLVEDQD